MLELIVGIAFRTVKALAGAGWMPDSVNFSHPRPRDRSSHAKFFGTDLHFNGALDGIVMRAGDLDVPIATSDPVVARYVRHYLDNVIAQPTVRVDAAVRQLVFTLLPSGRCGSDLVAKHMGIDRRTLSRRLGSRGTTFSAIVNDARLELVHRHIRTERRPLTEAAQLLGFSSLVDIFTLVPGTVRCQRERLEKSGVSVRAIGRQLGVPERSCPVLQPELRAAGSRTASFA